MLAKSVPTLSFLTCDEWAIEPTTTRLDVSKKGLKSADGTLLAGVLKGNSTLDSIVIGSKNRPVTIPLKELRENTIDALDYQGKKLLAEGGIVLASALKGNSSVTKVGQRVFDAFMFVLFLVIVF